MSDPFEIMTDCSSDVEEMTLRQLDWLIKYNPGYHRTPELREERRKRLGDEAEIIEHQAAQIAERDRVPA
jgi:hypothetical protein